MIAYCLFAGSPGRGPRPILSEQTGQKNCLVFTSFIFVFVRSFVDFVEFAFDFGVRTTVRISDRQIEGRQMIAGRDDDIEDMNVLVQNGLKYNVVRDELEAQIDRLGDDQFATFANEALIQLDEQYGVITPIQDRIQKLTNRYYRGLEILQTLDEPMTVDKLAADLGRDIDEVRDRVAYLVEFGRVHQEGDTVSSVE